MCWETANREDLIVHDNNGNEVMRGCLVRVRNLDGTVTVRYLQEMEVNNSFKVLLAQRRIEIFIPGVYRCELKCLIPENVAG